jgi:hypothetical protein
LAAGLTALVDFSSGFYFFFGPARKGSQRKEQGEESKGKALPLAAGLASWCGLVALVDFSSDFYFSFGAGEGSLAGFFF